jgi:DNA-binding NtrC family response regulator
VRDDGSLEYLKTYRLSAAQIRRAFLLQQLAAAAWNLDEAARSLDCTLEELARRLVNAGFGYLLKPAVRNALPNALRR